MKLLLDTHLLLWAAGKPDRLSDDVRMLIQDQQNELLFSSASFWEIVIKRALGRRDFIVEPRLLWRKLLDHGYTELSVNSSHVLVVDLLPPIHKDPFDRILVAQAISESMTLLTTDPFVARYPGPIHHVP